MTLGREFTGTVLAAGADAGGVIALEQLVEAGIAPARRGGRAREDRGRVIVHAVSETRTIEGPDGRLLELELSGPADGRLLVLHHGTPGAGSVYPPWTADGAQRGLRHLSYSRPGYAGSTRHAGRAVADCAADVAAIVDELGVDRFYTAGISGGGPHALACAALLPDRVIAAASIAGAAPSDAPDLDFLAGMGAENIEEFGAAIAGEAALRPFIEEMAVGLSGSTVEKMTATLGDLLGAADRAALTGEFAQYLLDKIAAALAGGVDGWLDDDFAFVSAWGFDVGAITVPVAVWQGGDDRFVPLGHGEWLAANVAGATRHIRPEHGHLSLQTAAYGEILDGLIAAGD